MEFKKGADSCLILVCLVMLTLSVMAQTNGGYLRTRPLTSRSAALNNLQRLRRFRLLNRSPADAITPIRYPRRNSQRLTAAHTVQTREDIVGPTSELRQGEEGSYTYRDPSNTILNEKISVKPRKSESEEVPSPDETERSSEVVRVGDTAILHCYFNEPVVNDGMWRTPTLIWWTKQPTTSERRSLVLGAGSHIRISSQDGGGRLKIVTEHDKSYSILLIYNVTTADAADYKCSLPTTTGTRIQYVSLEVLEPLVTEIQIPEKYHLVRAGDDVLLFCEPDGQKLTVWWTARNSESDAIYINRYSYKVMGSQLLVQDADLTSSGTYTCHVQNVKGPIMRRHFIIQVKEGPSSVKSYMNGFNMDNWMPGVNTQPDFGDNVQLRCDAEGIPLPAVEWYKDGVRIFENYKYNIKDFEPSYRENAVIGSLSITNLQMADEGMYSCKIINEISYVFREFLVQGYTERMTTEVVQPLVFIDDDEELVELGLDDSISSEGSGLM